MALFTAVISAPSSARQQLPGGLLEHFDGNLHRLISVMTACYKSKPGFPVQASEVHRMFKVFAPDLEKERLFVLRVKSVDDGIFDGLFRLFMQSLGVH
jgi:hypothetical protein